MLKVLKFDIGTPGKHFNSTKVSGQYLPAPTNLISQYKCVFKRYDAIDRWPENYSTLVISKGVAGLQNILSDGRRTISALFIAEDMIDSSYCENTKTGCLVALTNLEGHWVAEANCGKGNTVCTNHLLAFRQNLVQQNKFMIRHCNDLGKKSAIERIAAFMFECRHRTGINNGNNSVPLLLQRIDIADYLGLRPETLSRTIAKLERKNLIKILESNLVEILDMKCLRRIANGTSELKRATND